jgi:hypothetical protein
MTNVSFFRFKKKKKKKKIDLFIYFHPLGSSTKPQDGVGSVQFRKAKYSNFDSTPV